MAQELFHVHTYRCKHASNDTDEAYIRRAIEMCASSITFTDHAPFPGNPFGNRMEIEQLPEYIQSLKALKKKYMNVIDVKIGLEIEFFPRFLDYYKRLSENKDIDLLLLGQHMYECEDGSYSFSLPSSSLKYEEADGLCNAVVDGMKTGYFKVLAHPDRHFRRCGTWNSHMSKLARTMISTAAENHVVLEQNLSSMETNNHFRQEFWLMVPSNMPVIIGLDAHSVSDLDRIIIYEKEARKIC